MSVEQRCCFLSALANFRWRKSLGRHPNDFRDRRRYERLDPVEALDNAMAAPAVEQRLPILTGRNVSQHVANFIGIEDARCVTMRIKKDNGARPVQIDM